MTIRAQDQQAAQAVQHTAAHAPEQQVRLIAGPGSGKSSTIEERVCWLLDVRIEYDINERDHTLDVVEVMTPHYRGAHGAAKSGSGFTLYWSNRGGGGGRTPSIIEELLR